MRTLRLTLAYDGTQYVGWQRQPDGVSIQQLIEDAFVPFVEHAPGPSVVGAGRTDAGVHALGQVASVNVAFEHETGAIGRALNVRLPPDVRVLHIEDAMPGFHARFHATGKSYRYRVVTAAVASPFVRWFCWHAPARYDVDAIRASAGALVGRHDFASFQASGSSVAETTRTIERLEVLRDEDGLTFEISGDGFLRHMVRTIVGTLMEVGAGSRPVSATAEMLAARDRRAAGRTAPAQGLTLVQVRY
jgi:tRNA pseudouridine38-40 synthase